MGLQITARLVCDKCNVTTANLDSVDAPIPDGWMKDQGYANIAGGVSAALIGYYCDSCIQANGTKSLVKGTADMCPDLTGAPPT